MFALHLGYAQGQVCNSQTIALQTYPHPNNLGPPINIQNIHLYIIKINVSFCIGLIHVRCSHHEKNQDTCYLGR
jgi:hypothetical protein